MHKRFQHKEIEQKWQDKWAKDGLYDVVERKVGKEKEYVLVELPYPSGNLHIGHWYAFAVPDIYVRYQRMLGKDVIYPIGFDAFGLPAENAAIKRDINPREWTESNIDYMRSQLTSMGNAFTWNKTASTIDPSYYKWTQWMFTQFFEHDIAYRGEGTVNWCPGCNTVIANEQVLPDGTCERSGDEIKKKTMPQWMLRITDFADELVNDLDDLDWPEFIKESQRNWIGRSQGAEIDFKLSTGDAVTVFTTRPDTLFGATYMVLAPEHDLVAKNQPEITNWNEVELYIKTSVKKAEKDRLDGSREKTGVNLEGITATNPASGEEIPVFIADYVLASYGTGAIMAVPAHDERDFEFAQKFDVPVKQVVAPIFNQNSERDGSRRDGAYALLENSAGEFLIQKITQPVDSGDGRFYWLPGGGVGTGESIENALLRELEEETGYTNFEIKNKITVCEYDYSSNAPRSGTKIIHVYHVQLTSETQLPVKLDEGEVAHKLVSDWVPKTKIFDFINDGHQSRSDLVKHVFEKLENSAETGTGRLINSGEFNGMDSEEAKEAITKKVGGRLTNSYRLRDWSIGRQRYWGVPIPIVYEPAGKAHPIPEEHLPWTLPEDVDFRPTGEPPLAKSKELKARTEKIFGKGWVPEVETMDTFVDSSWYFLRYLDNQNKEAFCSQEAQNNWMPVDIYFGGAEHTTMHLLYSRFWIKALRKLGLTDINEPYQRRINRSLILGPDGNKMSKSKGNVIDPDEQVERVGSDAVKMYLAFMGPYAEVNNYPWDLGGIAGIRRFLERVNGLREHIIDSEPEETIKLLHKTIKKVRADIIEFKFNTAISAMMVFINQAEKIGLSQDSYQQYLKLLAPFAPHLTEELWSNEETGSIHLEDYPEYTESLTKDEKVTIGVQINGKLRGDITIPSAAEEEVAIEQVHHDEQLAKRLEGKQVVKIIYIPGRILNFITKEN